MPVQDPSVDSFNARNNTKVYILVDGQRVGRVQSFREDITNNVQVLSELGRDFMVELKKGITAYSFSIARFYTRKDVFRSLKTGGVFSLMVRDTAGLNDNGTGAAEILEFFQKCMIQTISYDYTNGAATIGQNASVVAIGRGKADV